jgi:hypothetical protein
MPKIGHIINTIFNASIELGHFPKPFRDSITVVLKKPGKLLYLTPKAYHPITLLNTLGKLLESIIATQIAYLVEEHDILPPNHLRGRKLLLCKLTLHQITTRVHQA